MKQLSTNHRQLCVKQLKVDAHVGVYDHEQGRTQPIWITITAWVKLQHSTPSEDKLDEIVDYDFLRDTAIKKVRSTHHALLETLSDKILDSLMEHPLIDAILLQLEKPEIFADCHSIGIETYREKSSFHPTKSLPS
jgi:dihydroneopterin aldolase